MSDVVLVTGGASGIGAAVARRFAKAGAHVVIADVNPAGEADVSSESDNDAAVATALDAYGRLDIVHLNAGAGGARGAGADFDLVRYRRTMAVNVDGATFGIRAALRAGARAIVVTSSLAGISPSSFDPFYSASKHAVIGMVRSIAAAVERIARGGDAGLAWIVQAGQSPVTVDFPTVDLARCELGGALSPSR